MKMKFKIIFISLAILLITNVASACSYHMPLGDDAVDWGRGIQWGGNTTYISQWNSSVSTWNAMGKVAISKDTWSTIEDLYLVDVNSPGVNIPSGYANSTRSANGTPYIQLNTALMGTYTSAEKQKCLTHELGHALGINEININGNIMCQGRSSQTSLGIKDKDVYRCIWG
ncbi:hypothetical protein MsAg5_12770 [Methanosarcinaceae archaeon Ag5]|uniref:Peptidase M43 pregnancy-associated plasma-A domain-containing protein n=1 Tax=Methanolapillus africanus TaxID=3028297 RepID=A0AAE4MJQ6_9EURY|nr:hypothetical protein [Methanosarcinaceae archaeon Ag5]